MSRFVTPASLLRYVPAATLTRYATGGNSFRARRRQRSEGLESTTKRAGNSGAPAQKKDAMLDGVLFVLPWYRVDQNR
jgi:hypothetical protein